MTGIIRSTLKLLFRNAMFWIFLLLAPVVSTLILRLEMKSEMSYEAIGREVIIEIDEADEKVGYFGGKGKYVIKVYDASGSELSEYMLNSLANSGMITVVRARTPDMTAEDVKERNHTDGYDDRMGAALYIDKDFDKYVLDGDSEKALDIYILSDDERYELLENEIKMCVGRISMAKLMGGEDEVIKTLDKLHENLPEKKIVMLDGINERSLTDAQRDQRALMGYAFAFLTLSFIFGGVLIAYTVINERKDMVLTRIRMTELTDVEYFASKFICGTIVSLLIAVVTTIATLSISTDKLGISRVGFFFMIYLLGLIFCSISLMIGMFYNDVMSATVSAFILWVLDSLLSGLYFSLDSASDAIKTVSHVMPSKWFLDVTELMLIKDNKGYFVILCVTVAYIVVTLGLGSIGIKIKKND